MRIEAEQRDAGALVQCTEKLVQFWRGWVEACTSVSRKRREQKKEKGDALSAHL